MKEEDRRGEAGVPRVCKMRINGGAKFDLLEAGKSTRRGWASGWTNFFPPNWIAWLGFVWSFTRLPIFPSLSLPLSMARDPPAVWEDQNVENPNLVFWVLRKLQTNTKLQIYNVLNKKIYNITRISKNQKLLVL